MTTTQVWAVPRGPGRWQLICAVRTNRVYREQLVGAPVSGRSALEVLRSREAA